MNCNKCGYILPSGVNCCPNCGTPIGEQSSNNNQQTPMQNVNQQPMNNQIQISDQNMLYQQSVNAQQPMPQIETTQVQSQPVSNEQKGNKKNKKGLFVIIFIGILLIIGGIFGVPKLKDIFNKISNNTSTKTVKTFMLPNNSNLFAVFNAEGEKLTDFKYIPADKFVNNTALVKNENGQYGIISSSGKELVPFGKYKEIQNIGAAYIARDSKDSYYLYNRAGKLVMNLNKNSVYLKNSSNPNYQYAGILDNNNFIFVNNAGEELLKIPFVSNENTIDETGEKIKPNHHLYYNKYLLVFYNNHNYIIDITSKEIIIDFESPLIYEIGAINENEIFLKSSRQNTKLNNTENKIYEYKLIKDKTVVYTKTHEKEIKYVYYNNNIIEFSDTDDSYILTETGEKILISNTQSIYEYIDHNNYLKRGENSNIQLYENGEYKKEFSCNGSESSKDSSHYASSGVYVLKYCTGYDDDNETSEENIIIKADGTILNDKVYYYVSKPDKNGNFVVSEDNKTSYLIDPNGKKLSKNYDYNPYLSNYFIIEKLTDKLYVGSNEDDTKTLFDIDGVEYKTAKYIELIDNATDDVLVQLEYDDYYVIYNVTKKKEILKTKNEPIYEIGYIMIENGNITEIYSYITGKKFHSVENN